MMEEMKDGRTEERKEGTEGKKEGRKEERKGRKEGKKEGMKEEGRPSDHRDWPSQFRKTR